MSGNRTGIGFVQTRNRTHSAFFRSDYLLRCPDRVFSIYTDNLSKHSILSRSQYTDPSPEVSKTSDFWRKKKSTFSQLRAHTSRNPNRSFKLEESIEEARKKSFEVKAYTLHFGGASTFRPERIFGKMPKKRTTFILLHHSLSRQRKRSLLCKISNPSL